MSFSGPAYIPEAHDGLDQTINAVMGGASLAPDYAMRMVIAIRDCLKRHTPNLSDQRFSSRHEPLNCKYDGQRYPCADARTALEALGINPDQEED